MKICIFQVDLDLGIGNIDFENPDAILNCLRVVVVQVPKELHAA